MTKKIIKELFIYLIMILNQLKYFLFNLLNSLIIKRKKIETIQIINLPFLEQESEEIIRINSNL